jgi:membrane-bound lytic murein transglycosylase MltF
MFDIIKFVPSKQMIITRKGEEPESISDLNNKTCSMVTDTSMAANMNLLIEEHDLTITYDYVDDFDLMGQKVIDGEVDFTVVDSDAAYRLINQNEILTVALPISQMQIMGWAIHKDDKVLNSVLQKYLVYAQNNQLLDRYWEESYGVTFIDYLKILQLD